MLEAQVQAAQLYYEIGLMREKPTVTYDELNESTELEDKRLLSPH